MIYNDISLSTLLQINCPYPKFFDELKMFEVHINELCEESQFQVYLNMANQYCFVPKEKNFDKALEYVLKAEDLLNGRPDNFKSDFHFVKGHIYARMGDYIKSKESFSKYIYYEHKDDSKIDTNNVTSEITFNSKIIEFEDSFYSFRTVNKYLLSDLINQEITLASPSEFNDPFDPLLFKFLDFRRKKIQQESGYDNKSQRDAYEYLKIRCFVRDNKKDDDRTEFAYKNNLMWSHYADSYKGICIRYRFAPKIRDSQILEKEFCYWRKVIYKELKFEDKGSANTELLFTTKNKCWEYENEFRLLHFNTNCETKHTQVPLSKIGGKIEAIFFGLRCAEIDKKTIISILGEKVKYFEFKDEIIPNTIIDNLELIDQEAFDNLDKQSMISYKMI